MTIVDVLRELGFVASNKEARRKLDEGAVKIDGVVVRDPAVRVMPAKPVPRQSGGQAPRPCLALIQPRFKRRF